MDVAVKSWVKGGFTLMLMFFYEAHWICDDDMCFLNMSFQI